MDINLWTWGGTYFGYRDGNELWTHDARHVGRFDGNEVYGRDGNYLGEIENENRLITRRSNKSSRRASFSPHAPRIGGVPYVNYSVT